MNNQFCFALDSNNYIIYSKPNTHKFEIFESGMEFIHVSSHIWNMPQPLVEVVGIEKDSGHIYTIRGKMNSANNFVKFHDWQNVNAMCQDTTTRFKKAFVVHSFFSHYLGILENGGVFHAMRTSYIGLPPPPDTWSNFAPPFSANLRFQDADMVQIINFNIDITAVKTDGTLFHTIRYFSPPGWSHLTGNQNYQEPDLHTKLGLGATKISSVLACIDTNNPQGDGVNMVYLGTQNGITQRNASNWENPKPLNNVVVKTQETKENAKNNNRKLTPYLVDNTVWGLMNLEAGTLLSSILAEKSTPGTFDTSPLRMTGLPTINISLCNGCGTCVDVCPTNYFKIVNEKAVVNVNECVNCSVCIFACEEKAIS